MFQRCAVICALGLSALLAGCRKSGVQSCLDLTAAGQYEKAAARCAEVYATGRDDRAGASAVFAHYSLGHGDEVLVWVDRLAKDGKVRPGVWTLAADLHKQRGEFEAADREYRSDLALYQAAGHHQRAADILNRLSNLSWQRSRYREAFLFASQALEEAIQAKDQELEAKSADGLYKVLYAVGDLAGARQALKKFSELGGAKDGQGRVLFLVNRSNVLADEGRFAMARRDLEEALAAGAGISYQPLLRTIHLNLTDIHLVLGDVGRAAHHLEEAWKHVEPGEPEPVSLLYYRGRVDLAVGRAADAARVIARALTQDPAPDWAWDLEYQRGRAEEARGNLKAAEAAHQRSIEIVEEMRRSVAFDELKSWLLDKKRQPFEALFRLQARAGRAEEALATAERAQARTLLDAFLHAHSSEGSPQSSWSPDVAAARIGDLERLLPVMSESPVAAPQPIDQVLLAFGDRHGLLYFEAGDELWLITVSEGKIRLRPLTAPAAEIRQLAERFIAHPEDAGSAGRLGEILLPSRSLPEEGKTVYIVANGILGNLPFAALRRGDRYLVEGHAITLIPSLSALAALERHGGEPPLGPPLVLVDSRGNLPAASLEGREIAKLLAGELRTARAATSHELQKATRARSLHLATHTGLSSRGPWLLLADRRLGTAEIVMLRIGPRLVVLASCASGARTGRQMWGSLGAAFLAAGSRAVVASLWSVEDKATRDFVLRFYTEGGASNPAGALARAQRVAIGRGQSPNLWAPFVLFGSDRRLD